MQVQMQGVILKVCKMKIMICKISLGLCFRLGKDAKGRCMQSGLCKGWFPRVDNDV